jgi:hypothetical protein
VPDYPELHPVDPPAQALADASADGQYEHLWRTQRLQRLNAAATPLAHETWWSAERNISSRPPLDAPERVSFRRNVLLLARVEGVLIEERIDLVYESGEGYVLLLRGSNDPQQQRLRAGRTALAFQVCCGNAPAS